MVEKSWRPLQVNLKYSKLVPQHSKEDYLALEESIVAHNGAFESIKINKKDEVLDGHTRYNICSKHTLGFTTETVDLPTELDEEIYVIETNLKRRQLNSFQSTELNLILAPYLAEKGRLNLVRPINEKGQFAPVVHKDTIGIEKVDSLGSIAEKSHVGRMTVSKVKKILEKAPEDLKQKARTGKISIGAAYTQITRAEKHTNTPVLPSGEFDIILADCPWKYDFCLEGNPEDHYAEMATDDICALNVPSAKDAILFLWATNPKLEDALKVVKAWGFHYVTNLVWVKTNSKGLGYYSLAQHELLLICKKGSIPPPQAENRPSSVVNADRTAHSCKPEIFYDIIEKMYPNRSGYLELFSRKQRPKWTSWGNQLETS